MAKGQGARVSRFRLICPNCGAQYDVPMDVIPARGRDVQCSNCGHTWFQGHAQVGEDIPLVEPVADPKVRTPASPPPAERPAPKAPAEPVEAETATDEATVDAAVEAPVEPEDEGEEDGGKMPPAPPRRELDPSVLGVLREEAAYENRRRQEERGALEVQSDLGLEEPSSDDARRKRNLTLEAGAHTVPAPSSKASGAARERSREEAFPDLDEVSQSLRHDRSTRRREAEPEAREGGSGFVTGFVLVVVVAALALAIYSSASQIAEAVPEAAPMLEAYADQVDAARRWLDESSTDLLMRLDAMSSEAAQGDGE
ncbi:putative Zn finger-like uncharacterized protein [Allosediminivita pacifica]|uniref:Putative Zn finger-like uncharacterized protein n=1 Tax=Allosediminivita pacifica TaxID=1267769 RepID=A0A2T6BA09_9RHOB|nr:putative Zn finger-like uncharacterized protein [Allosediminivita pacifica]